MKLRDLGLKSLQTRLLLGAFIWIVVGLLLSGVAITGLFRQYVTGQFHHELSDHLTELSQLATLKPGNQLRLPRPLSDPRFAVAESGYYWEIWRDGHPVMRSESLGGRDIVDGGPKSLQVERTRAPADPGGPYLDFAVAGDSRDLTAVMARFQTLLAVSLGVISLGLCAAAAAQVGFGLSPLRRLRLALSDVRVGRAQALSEDFPIEVQPLVRDLNALIGAQAGMVRRARAQAGNLGHALRTPLAILTAEAERLAA